MRPNARPVLAPKGRRSEVEKEVRWDPEQSKDKHSCPREFAVRSSRLDRVEVVGCALEEGRQKRETCSARGKRLSESEGHEFTEYAHREGAIHHGPSSEQTDSNTWPVSKLLVDGEGEVVPKGHRKGKAHANACDVQEEHLAETQDLLARHLHQAWNREEGRPRQGDDEVKPHRSQVGRAWSGFGF